MGFVEIGWWVVVGVEKMLDDKGVQNCPRVWVMVVV